jgi:hypothetical protein
MVLVAVPLLSTVMPPLFDYPNHLARMHLLLEGGNEFYAVHWEALPNLAEDLIVPPLARLVPLETASKLFVILTFGLIAGATVCLNRVATGVWRLWPLLAFLLLYNRTFLWGFLNYLFGLGFALAGIAAWLALERARGWLRVLISSVCALACYISHIAAFGAYLLVILGIELGPALNEARAHRWAALCRRIAVLGAQFLIPVALFLAYRHEAASIAVSHIAFWRKADLLFGVFDNYNRIFDVACFALFLSLLGWLAWTRRLRLAPRLGGAVAIVFAAYLLLPNQIYGGSGADHRLVIAIWLLLIAGTAPHFHNRREGIVVAGLAAAMLIVRLGVIEHVWLKANSVYVADLEGIDALPDGVKLAVAVPADAIHVVPIPEVHLPVLAVERRGAFVPTLFAYPGQQPIGLNTAFAALASAATPQRFWFALTGGSANEAAAVQPVLQHYDYVAVIGAKPLNTPPGLCLDEFYRQPTFQLLQVRHDPLCTSPDG